MSNYKATLYELQLRVEELEAEVEDLKAIALWLVGEGYLVENKDIALNIMLGNDPVTAARRAERAHELLNPVVAKDQ